MNIHILRSETKVDGILVSAPEAEEWKMEKKREFKGERK